MSRALALDLYLVTDRGMCAARGIERVVGEAVAGGVTMVQLRDDAHAGGRARAPWPGGSPSCWPRAGCR